MERTQATSSLERLEERMRAGDREATAELLMMNAGRIRRHLRLKLSASTRRVFDSLDVLSSAARQVDRAVMNRTVQFDDTESLVGYVIRSTTSLSITKTQIAQRMRRYDSDDRVIAAHLSRVLGDSRDEDLDASLREIASLVPDDEDRFVLWSWLGGRPHVETAELLGKSAAAVRQQWKTIRDRLADRLGDPRNDTSPRSAAERSVPVQSEQGALS